MYNIALRIAYHGAAYSGFQVQPDQDTIQKRLEDAIYRLTGERTEIIGSGRTDTGVHARWQVVNFFTKQRIPEDRWPHALNTVLPKDISVLSAARVPENFHSRKGVTKKTYRYFIETGRCRNVFGMDFASYHPLPLRVEQMHAAAQYLVGTHDFTSFCSTKSEKTSHVRTIYEIECTDTSAHMDVSPHNARLQITISGNGFLYNMVRIIVGTLIQVGEGKREPHEIAEILKAKDRRKAGPTAPSSGLILWEIEYGGLRLFT